MSVISRKPHRHGQRAVAGQAGGKGAEQFRLRRNHPSIRLVAGAVLGAVDLPRHQEALLLVGKGAGSRARCADERRSRRRVGQVWKVREERQARIVEVDPSGLGEYFLLVGVARGAEQVDVVRLRSVRGQGPGSGLVDVSADTGPSGCVVDRLNALLFRPVPNLDGVAERGTYCHKRHGLGENGMATNEIHARPGTSLKLGPVVDGALGGARCDGPNFDAVVDMLSCEVGVAWGDVKV